MDGQAGTLSGGGGPSAPPAAGSDAATTPRAARGLELGLVAFAIALAGSVTWGVIRLAFPRSTVLAPPVAAAPAPMAAAASPAVTAPVVTFEGVIASLRRPVQMRAGSELAWADARTGQAVHTDDGIQTLAGASAVVRVRGQGDIRIGENSLVVFAPNAGDPFLPARLPVATVDHGELTGTLTAGPDRDALGIRLPHGAIRLQAQRAGQAAGFRVQVNGDRSAAVVILRGRAQVQAGGGTRQLGSGEGLRISADGRQVEARSIPAVPLLQEPAADQVIVWQKARPDLVFRWQVAGGAEGFHFQLAEDREFHHVLADEHVDQPSFTAAAVKTGEYFWRVSASNGWLEGAAAAPAVIRVERNLDAGVRDALADLYGRSPEAESLAKQAQGVLVFPSVIKGGLVIGGEYGEGALLSHGRTVDYYAVKSASIGLQIGGQTRRMVLLFMTPEAYEGFAHSSGWKVGVDGSVTIANLGTTHNVGAATAGSPVIGFVYASRGLMSNLTLEGSRISRLPD